jgi:hypothetical protein
VGTPEPDGPPPWLPDVGPPDGWLGGSVGVEGGLPPVGDWRGVLLIGVLLIGVGVAGAATCVEPLATDAAEAGGATGRCGARLPAGGGTTTLAAGGEPGPSGEPGPGGVGRTCTVPESRSTATAAAPARNGSTTTAARRAIRATCQITEQPAPLGTSRLPKLRAACGLLWPAPAVPLPRYSFLSLAQRYKKPNRGSRRIRAPWAQFPGEVGSRALLIHSNERLVLVPDLPLRRAERDSTLAGWCPKSATPARRRLPRFRP